MTNHDRIEKYFFYQLKNQSSQGQFHMEEMTCNLMQSIHWPSLEQGISSTACHSHSRHKSYAYSEDQEVLAYILSSKKNQSLKRSSVHKTRQAKVVMELETIRSHPSLLHLSIPECEEALPFPWQS